MQNQVVKNFWFLCIIFFLIITNCTQEDKNWGSVTAGKDADGRWEATLENNTIFVRYGFKLSGDKEEGMITDFTLKEFPEENIAGHLMDAAASRGLITKTSIVKDNSEVKKVRVEWEPIPEKKDRFPGPAVSEISIFPNSDYIKIDYLSYCFPHVVDIGAPGGLDCPTTDPNCGGEYVIYSAKAWQKVRMNIQVDSLRNHPNEHHRVTNDLFPLYPNPLIDRNWGENKMSYKGWYIMGVYHNENKRGYGRIFTVKAVPYIKLLWNKGFELFPYWRTKPEPHAEYLFAVIKGEEEILSKGKELVEKELKSKNID